MNAQTFDYHDQPMPYIPVNMQCRIHNAQKPRTVAEIMAALEASEQREIAIMQSLRGDMSKLIELIKPLVGG